MAYQDDDAVRRLAGIADYFLTHDRPIHMYSDDSVIRIVSGEELPLRRSRGYVPLPIRLATPCPVPILACGGQLKNTFCLAKGEYAVLSHHIGDLEDYRSYCAFLAAIEHFKKLFEITPQAVAYDLHPGYLSSQYALTLHDLPHIPVQHHHAHIASCMAEHGCEGPVIGVAWDGTGYGTDGRVWGEEFLLAFYAEFKRLAHLEEVPLPGGKCCTETPRPVCAARMYRMNSTPLTSSSMPGQPRQDTSLHEAAWPDMLNSLHAAYSELTRTQLELERRMHENNEAREFFERVIESMASSVRQSLIGDVGRIAALLHDHAAALGDYLTSDPRGKQIPNYLAELADHLAQERTRVLNELASLSSKIEYVRQIISMQQSFISVGGLQGLENMAEIMEEALTINFASLERHHIEVIREYAEVPPVVVDRHLVLQILVNLVSNAKYAMLALEGRLHRLTLRVALAEDHQGFVRLQVQDTGVGIKPEHLSRIFAQGFTTKRDGHGLGLHSGALAARMMEGSISVHSDGEGQGATFTLDLPLKTVEERV